MTTTLQDMPPGIDQAIADTHRHAQLWDCRPTFVTLYGAGPAEGSAEWHFGITCVHGHWSTTSSSPALSAAIVRAAKQFAYAHPLKQVPDRELATWREDVL